MKNKIPYYKTKTMRPDHFMKECEYNCNMIEANENMNAAERASYIYEKLSDLYRLLGKAFDLMLFMREDMDEFSKEADCNFYENCAEIGIVKREQSKMRKAIIGLCGCQIILSVICFCSHNSVLRENNKRSGKNA